MPDVNSVIVRQALQNVSILYRNPNYVADQVFPIVNDISSKAKVAKYQKGPWFRNEAEPRAPGAPARILDYSFLTQDLNPITYAVGATVSDELREEALKSGNLPQRPEIDVMELMANSLDLNREARTASIIHSSVWSGIAASGEDAAGHWGDGTAANDTTLADICKAIDTIVGASAIYPNSILLSYPAWSKLRTAPALLALMNPSSLTREALVTPAAFGALIGLPRVIIGSAIKNTAEETVPTDSFTSVNIWGTSGSETKGIAFIYYYPPSVGLLTASAGYQYRVNQANGAPRLSTTWREAARHADCYDTQESTDIAAVCLDAGYLFKNTATA